ncbi:MAG: VCBS repeat-containing protein [Planctomycetota bacterium]
MKHCWRGPSLVVLSVLLGSASAEAQCIEPLLYAQSSVAVAPFPCAVASWDFDGDGQLDLAVATDGAGLMLALGLGAGNFAPAVPAAGGQFARLVTADFDADGDGDVAGLNAALVFGNDVSLYSGGGDGTLQLASMIDTDGAIVSSWAVGDYDDDGLPDLALADVLTFEARVLLNNAGWTGSSLSLPSGVAHLTSADVDSDGDLDVALSVGADLLVLENLGGGSAWNRYNAGSGAGGAALVSGDVDSDGFVDLVTGGTAPQISVFRGDGSSFQLDAHVPWPAVAVPGDLVLEDLEQDGDLDLFAMDLGTRWGIFENVGGSLLAPQEYVAGEGWLSPHLAVGDFNSDGLADVAAPNLFSSTVDLLLSKGVATTPLFAEPSQPVPDAPAGQAFGTGLIATDDQLGFHYSIDGPDGANVQSYYVLADGAGLKGGVSTEPDPTVTLLLPDVDVVGGSFGTSGLVLQPTGCTGTTPDHFVGTILPASTTDEDYSYVGLYVRPNDDPCCDTETPPDDTVPRGGSATAGFVKRFAIGSQRLDCGGSEEMVLHFFSLIEDGGVQRLEWVRCFVNPDDTVTFGEVGRISKGDVVDGFRVAVNDSGVGIVWAEEGELYVRTSVCGETWVETMPQVGETILSYDLGIEGNTVRLVVAQEAAEVGQIVKSSFSTDGGGTFSPSVQLSSAPAGTNVGALELVMTGGGTGAVAIWEDDRFGADAVFAASVDAPGGSWTAERCLGCGESPGLVVGSGAVEQVAAYWTTNTNPRRLMASLSLDGGASWDAPIAIDSGSADVVEPVAAYEELYDRFAFAWLAADGSGDLAPYFGGFRTQTLVPQGWQQGPTTVSFDVANFLDEECEQAWVLLSAMPGSLPLPDGRDLPLAPEAVLSAGLFVAPLDAAGAGTTGSLPVVLPPGLSLYAVAVGFKPIAALVCEISGVAEIQL